MHYIMKVYIEKEKKKKMNNVLGYIYKIYKICYNTDMINEQCNAGDPLDTAEAYTEDHLLC